MAFNRAGIEKAWESIAAKGSALKESAAEFAETAKNSRAGGMVSDSAAAIHGIGLHTLGGAAMGGTINAAAYALQVLIVELLLSYLALDMVLPLVWVLV
jgi:hypothetical protein